MDTHIPKISVIIHFLNSENYLSEAIDSVLRQTYSNWELLLVDGGSQDRTPEICLAYQERFPSKIKIFRHRGEETLGIFSSRIWGAKEASAPILALLDSDDEWHPQFLERQYTIYQSEFHSSPGMVYCPVIYWWEKPELAFQAHVQPVPSPGLHEAPRLIVDFLENHYQKSAANSGVMISRELILEAEELIGTANEGMVEDQFLWSFLLIKYPAFVNPEPLVRYRQWTGSTCAVTSQKGKQKELRKYHLQWLLYYIEKHYSQGNEYKRVWQSVKALFDREFPPSKPVKVHVLPTGHSGSKNKMIVGGKQLINTTLQHVLPGKMFHAARKKYQYGMWASRRIMKETANVLHSSLKARIHFMSRIEPLSYRWGDDRGGVSIFRHYIEEFLQESQADIQGHCLEFQEDHYTSRFGGDKVGQVDILHIDDNNPKATLVADLTKSNDLQSDTFDCIICTHVLHVIYELDKAIAELFRILKPGGVLLVAVPHVSMCDPDWHELWRFTPEGLLRVLESSFPASHIIIKAYGNSLTAAGVIRGMGAHEFSANELEIHDHRFGPEVCARVVK